MQITRHVRPALLFCLTHQDHAGPDAPLVVETDRLGTYMEDTYDFYKPSGMYPQVLSQCITAEFASCFCHQSGMLFTGVAYYLLWKRMPCSQQRKGDNTRSSISSQGMKHGLLLTAMMHMTLLLICFDRKVSDTGGWQIVDRLLPACHGQVLPRIVHFQPESAANDHCFLRP